MDEGWESAMPMSGQEREALGAMLAALDRDLIAWTEAFRGRLRAVSRMLEEPENPPVGDPECRSRVVD